MVVTCNGDSARGDWVRNMARVVGCFYSDRRIPSQKVTLAKGEKSDAPLQPFTYTGPG